MAKRRPRPSKQSKPHGSARQDPASWSDHYTKKAKQSGFLARSVFKLDEIEEKFHILSACIHQARPKIMDLGSAPGSWIQWCLSQKRLNHATILSIDLQPLQRTITQHQKRVHHIIGDMNSDLIFAQVAMHAPFALILCDAAPATTGQKIVDDARSQELNRCAVHYAKTYLGKGGNFVCKLFFQEATKALCASLKTEFEKIKLFKPQSSRSGSREQYVIAMNKH